MGLVGLVKENKVVAVIISVFDWYRECIVLSCLSRAQFGADNPWYSSFALSDRGEEAPSKARPRHSYIWLSQLYV